MTRDIIRTEKNGTYNIHYYSSNNSFALYYKTSAGGWGVDIGRGEATNYYSFGPPFSASCSIRFFISEGYENTPDAQGGFKTLEEAADWIIQVSETYLSQYGIPGRLQ